MHFCEHTCPALAEDLALDEALLDRAEQADEPAEVLRLWEPPRLAVVVGRASDVAREVDLAACRLRDVPVQRRISGGAAVVVGPGCLMYSLVLSYQLRPELRDVSRAHAAVLGRIVAGLASGVPGLERAGTSDLAAGGRKVSGNSVRLRRRHLLYHGTLLYAFPLESIGELLSVPPRQPAYRAGRVHADFVANLPLSRDELSGRLRAAWDAREGLAALPWEATERLAEARYRRPEWIAGASGPSDEANSPPVRRLP